MIPAFDITVEEEEGSLRRAMRDSSYKGRVVAQRQRLAMGMAANASRRGNLGNGSAFAVSGSVFFSNGDFASRNNLNMPKIGSMNVGPTAFGDINEDAEGRVSIYSLARTANPTDGYPAAKILSLTSLKQSVATLSAMKVKGQSLEAVAPTEIYESKSEPVSEFWLDNLMESLLTESTDESSNPSNNGTNPTAESKPSLSSRIKQRWSNLRKILIFQRRATSTALAKLLRPLTLRFRDPLLETIYISNLAYSKRPSLLNDLIAIQIITLSTVIITYVACRSWGVTLPQVQGDNSTFVGFVVIQFIIISSLLFGRIFIPWRRKRLAKSKIGSMGWSSGEYLLQQRQGGEEEEDMGSDGMGLENKNVAPSKLFVWTNVILAVSMYILDITAIMYFNNVEG
jgi:hypothetical protein